MIIEKKTIDMTPAEESVWMDSVRMYVREFNKAEDNSIVQQITRSIEHVLDNVYIADLDMYSDTVY